ncbi:MAG: NTP transferase domain-containing protein, partial [Nitrospinota bacterium]
MPGETAVSIVLLAAGLSRRTGRNKLLLPLGGKPVVRRVAEAACAAGAREVIAVTGHEGDLVADALAGLPLRRAHNPEYREGQASSLRAGLREVDRGSRGVMFVLGDQPLITPEL